MTKDVGFGAIKRNRENGSGENEKRAMTDLEKRIGVSFVDESRDPFPGEIGRARRVEYGDNQSLQGIYRGYKRE